MFFKRIGVLPLLAILGLTVSCAARRLVNTGNDGSVVFDVQGIEKLNPDKQQFHMEIVKLDTANSVDGTVEKALDFSIKNEVKVSKVTLGPKEFRLSVIAKDGSGKIYYYGNGRHVVVAGPQKLSQPIALKKREYQGELITAKVRVELSLAGVGQPANPAPSATLPDDVKAVVVKGECGKCHKTGSSTNKGFGLDKFPYTSTRAGLDSLSKVAAAMSNAIESGEMPVGGELSPAQVSTFSKWAKSLNASNPGTGGGGDISALPIDLVEISWKSEKYEFLKATGIRLTKVAPGVYEGSLNNVPAGQKIITTLTVGNAGRTYVKDDVLNTQTPVAGQPLVFQVKVKGDLADPEASVEIPVVIE